MSKTDGVVISFPGATSAESSAPVQGRTSRQVTAAKYRKGAALRRQEEGRLAAFDGSARAALDRPDHWVAVFRAMLESCELDEDSLTVADVVFLTGRTEGAADLLGRVWGPYERRVQIASDGPVFDAAFLRPRPAGVIGAGHARRVVTALLAASTQGGYAWGAPRALARIAAMAAVRQIEALHAELVDHASSGSRLRFSSAIPGGDEVALSARLDYGCKFRAVDAVAILHGEVVAGVHSYIGAA